MANSEAWLEQDLIAWRKDLGWTQTQAAQELGVTLRGYQKREAGESPITRETMLACGALRLEHDQARFAMMEFKPGSEEAKARGCICSAPNLRPDGKILFPIEKGCPVHDKPAPDALAVPNRRDFLDQIGDLIDRAEVEKREYIDINAGEVHRAVGNYPGPMNRMPVCCSVMRTLMQDGDQITTAPPKGAGASLTIRYYLPRN
jgi:5-methylcytosine-specific restriction protein A